MLRFVVLSLCLGACSGRSTCPAGDLDCLARAFAITDFQQFDDPNAREHLTMLATALPLTSSTKLALSATGDLNFANASDGKLILLSWSDANGCRPSFCMNHCPHGVRCTAGARCTPARRDGMTSATTQHWIQYDADPPAHADFDLVITPMSASGCPTDPAMLIADPTVAVGPPVTIPVHLPAPDSGGGGGTCGTDLEASTLVCTPLGSSGAADTCVTDAQYRAIFGTGLPASCAPSGTTGCLDTQKGALVKPCCPGLTCKVGSACGGGSVVGGVCM